MQQQDFSQCPTSVLRLHHAIVALPAKSVCGSGMSPEAVPGVSLLAGSLPGVQLMPFHVRDASLPPFTAQQWASLLRKHTNHSSSSSVSRSGASGAPGIDSNACAAIIFSAPHFTEVESFLQRLSSALPNIPVRCAVLHQLLSCCTFAADRCCLAAPFAADRFTSVSQAWPPPLMISNTTNTSPYQCWSCC